VAAKKFTRPLGSQIENIWGKPNASLAFRSNAPPVAQEGLFSISRFIRIIRSIAV